MARRFEYAQAEEIRDVFARHDVRYLFIGKSGAIWRIDGLAVGYCSPALARDRLYVVTNSASLVALDASDGRRIWEYSIGRVGKGSPVVTPDGVIYVGEQNVNVLGGLGAPLTDLAVISIVPAVAGGAAASQLPTAR